MQPVLNSCRRLLNSSTSFLSAEKASRRFFEMRFLCSVAAVNDTFDLRTASSYDFLTHGNQRTRVDGRGGRNWPSWGWAGTTSAGSSNFLVSTKRTSFSNLMRESVF